MKEIIQVGWPDNKNGLSPSIINYFHIRDELVVQEGVILRGDRVVIPKSLRRETLEDLHTAHQGVESTLRRARESVYWPNMNGDVKEYISRCETCTTFPPRQQKEPLLDHKVPNRPLGQNRHRPLSFRKQRIPGDGGLFFKFLWSRPSVQHNVRSSHKEIKGTQRGTRYQMK